MRKNEGTGNYGGNRNENSGEGEDYCSVEEVSGMKGDT